MIICWKLFQARQFLGRYKYLRRQGLTRSEAFKDAVGWFRVK
jgi:hypothetical protein